MKKVLEVKNLNKSFGKIDVLHDINFEIYPNEIVGFIGPNGAGKSTVMKCIMSLIFPTSGEITVNGYDIKENRMEALESLAGVIEEPGLFRDLSGENNIRLFAELRNVPETRIQEIMDFTKLGKNLKRNAGEYSLGMKQRLALGIALLSKPKLLILDEPTNGLDPTAVMELRETLMDLVKNEDISILFSSHQLEEVERLSHRLISINQGRIVDKELLSIDTNLYILESDEIDLLEAYLKEMEYIYTRLEDKLEVTISENMSIQRLMSDLLSRNISVDQINLKQLSLEERYKEIYINKN